MTIDPLSAPKAIEPTDRARFHRLCTALRVQDLAVFRGLLDLAAAGADERQALDHVQDREPPLATVMEYASAKGCPCGRTSFRIHSITPDGRIPVSPCVPVLAAHAAESRFVHAQDAAVTATMLQNLGPVLAALQPTKDAVIRAGALLIVKVDWIVAVHQLTPAQQLQLDHQPQLAQSPHDILSALERRAGSSTPSHYSQRWSSHTPTTYVLVG